MARIKSATTQNSKRKRKPKHVELFDLLPAMESVNPRNGYGLVWHMDYRGHWRKSKWKNSKPKWKK